MNDRRGVARALVHEDAEEGMAGGALPSLLESAAVAAAAHVETWTREHVQWVPGNVMAQVLAQVKMREHVTWSDIAKCLPARLSEADLSYLSFLTDAHMREMAKSCSRLVSVDVSGCPLVSASGVKAVVEAHGAHLEELRVAGTRVDDKMLRSIGKHCHVLRTLHIAHSGVPMDSRDVGFVASASVTARGLGALGRAPPTVPMPSASASPVHLAPCLALGKGGARGEHGQGTSCKWASLRTLALDHMPVDEQVALRLAVGNAELHTLSLFGCTQLTDAALHMLVVAAGPSLRDVDVSACVQLTDEGMASLVRHAPHLVALRVRECVKLTQATLEAISGNLHALRVLDVAGCFDITNVGVLASGCPRLEELSLQGVFLTSDAALLPLADACPHLHTIDLSACRLVSDDGVSALARGTALRAVGLAGVPITDVALVALARSRRTARALRHVDLTGCRAISDDGVALLGMSCHALHTLNLGFCKHLTNAGLVHVLRGCPQLRALSLRAMPHVDDATMRELATHCPHVHTLHVRETAVTGVGVRALAPLGGALEELDLTSCDVHDADGDLTRLLTACPSLRHLDLTLCNALQHAQLSALRVAFPRRNIVMTFNVAGAHRR